MNISCGVLVLQKVCWLPVSNCWGHNLAKTKDLRAGLLCMSGQGFQNYRSTLNTLLLRLRGHGI